MASPNQKLAASLSRLRILQRNGRRVFQSEDLTRIHRQRLLDSGFLQEAVKGWLISSSPSTGAGESTPWYASFWEFCARYCQDRFGSKWHLSPEQSTLLLAENTVVPTQVIVHSPAGTNNAIKLPFATSLYDLKSPLPPAADLITRDGLRLFSPTAALIRLPEYFFRRYPVETQLLVTRVRDSSDILGPLLSGGHSSVAGRLAGAFRRMRRADIADEILTAMKSAGYDVRESDPFEPNQILAAHPVTTPAIVGRIQTLWETSRGTVLKIFPRAPGLPADTASYLHRVDESYKSDAYHSLSIEGYRVTPELITRVASGIWDPATREADKSSRDALAARGYWQAFQKVKASVAQIIQGANPGKLVRTAHRDWYRELFQPCVAVGLIPPSALAGYRNEAVYLRTSRYVPPRWESVRDAMPAFFDLLEQEPEPAVRAVLGHWLFGYIHPFPDGNGRLARFLMNAMLASGGYKWTIIRVDDRAEYLAALDSASINADLAPFTAFLAKRVRPVPRKRAPLQSKAKAKAKKR
jgi:fido (protein-threonine AMPylation protein)